MTEQMTAPSHVEHWDGVWRNRAASWYRMRYRSYVLESAGWVLPSTVLDVAVTRWCDCLGQVYRPCVRVEFCLPLLALVEHPADFGGGLSLRQRLQWFGDLERDLLVREPWLIDQAGCLYQQVFR